MAIQRDTESLRPLPAPVIRRVPVAEEDAGVRLLNRYVPAWVLSGLLHALLIASLILVDWLYRKDDSGKQKNLKAATTNTSMDEPPPTPEDLTNANLNLDADLAPVADATIEKDVDVTAPELDEPIGLDRPATDFVPPAVAMNQGSLIDLAGPSGINGPTGETGVSPGELGRGNEFAMPGYIGRNSGATRDKLVRNRGGTRGSELAVAMGLAWLARQQNSAGYWEFDGGHKTDRIAATGLCLLPFLAAGETHMTGNEPKYREKVAKGLAYLRKELKANGQFGNSGMYAQPIAAIALCEAAGMTQDKTLRNAAKLAVDFIVRSQGGNGSWGYTAGSEGDTSIVGWNIQALKSARLSGISVPDKAFKQAEAFLNSVSNDSGASYGYRGPGAAHTLSAVGLLCRQYMGWTPRHPSLARGVDILVAKYPPQKNDFNMYYYYYATQVVHFFGGRDWEVKWNPVMRQLLVDLQITAATPNAKAADVGSWAKDNSFIGSECGKLGTTALAVLTLEVYYRHLPLYKRDAGGALMDLERGN